MTSRFGHLLAACALATPCWCAMPAAHAVTPPPVDERWLPQPAPPGPPSRTRQREVCAAATWAPERPEAAAQLAGLDLPEAWRLTRGSGQRVAVIDTGVAHHRRLAHLVAGGDYVFTGDGTQDCDAHGTIVAGIIAAAPDSATDQFSGVAPDATVIGIRQSSAKFSPVGNRSSTGVGDVDTMARAVRTAADLGASVINISTIACVAAESPPDDRALGAALAYAVDVKNAVIVAAAGNTGGAAQCPSQRPETSRDTATVVVSPAWYDDYVLTVGSVNANGEPSAFTLPSPWVDVAAGGENVTSLNPVGDGTVNGLDDHGGFRPLSGTSYAAPVVSGLAALIRARFPALTARQVMARIISTAHHPPHGWDPFVGNGTVDVLAAVSSDPAVQPAPAQPGPPTPAAPVTTPPAQPDRRARITALSGSAICLMGLLAALASRAFGGRSGSRHRRIHRDDVVGD
ncbi:type VII secretion system ESX-4 serine protease mycosin MycP4 [Mycobacterium marinum]|uniref:type VII secretion system ESX-4 serine protease mycosin MycP4 n=1 Tax=Mycobacterium marinum TaxID=1781 RepID=UPI0021C4184F|nr:type VII secretion system ESX-4 serine protease mycosin MycP4 [Mycobacterium marinum]